jgi:CRP-like cAMP-binding protein
MLQILKKCQLFRGMTEADIQHILNCLGSRKKTYRRNEYIFMEGEKQPKVGVILSGTVQAIKETKNGGLILINQMNAGDTFGLSYVCAQTDYLPISIISTDQSEVLFIELDQLVRTCHNACQFHIDMIKNALWILAQKNLFLDTKMYYISHKTIRERLMTYLEDQETRADSREFEIPLNREQLADFLCADRSALSRELGHLKEEGILDYKKNWFRMNS